MSKVFRRALKHAGLRTHFSPHSLRHTYASLLLADGVSPAYVQEQLGHASIELTVGTYGRWLRKRAPGAVDRLDHAPGGLAETAAVGGHSEEPADTPATPPTEPPGSSLVANPPSQVSKARPRQRKLLKGLVTRLGLEPRTQRLRVGPRDSPEVVEGDLKQPKDKGKPPDGEDA